jgi:hypothetical protein
MSKEQIELNRYYKIFSFKLPVLWEMSAMWFWRRVLSGERKVRIEEVGILPLSAGMLSSASLGEHYM